MIERALIGSGGGPFSFDAVVQSPGAETNTHVSGSSSEENLALKDLERIEREIINRALEESKGRIYGDLGAAARLGLRPTTLAYRIKKLSVHNRHKPATIRWDSSRMLR